MGTSKRQNIYNARYRKQLTIKQVVFYKHEQELAEFANSINFQKFVKACLSTYSNFTDPCVSKVTMVRSKDEFNLEFKKGGE